MLINFLRRDMGHLFMINNIHIYFKEILHDLCVGLPYEFVTNEGDMNYRLKVMYNNNNMVPRNIMLFDPVSQGQYNYIYTTENST